METAGSTINLLVFLASVLALTYISSQVKSYYRLRHIPGPLIPSLTNWWATINVWTGYKYTAFIQDLHDKHGPVVRWGPNRVSFAKPAAVPEVYGVHRPFSKAPSYEPMNMNVNGRRMTSIIATRNDKHISEMKRYISVGFAQSTWLKQENQIDTVLRVLIEKLRSKAGTEIDLRQWLSYWSFDTLTTLAFGESREYLQHEADRDGVLAGGAARFKHWGLWMSMPSLEALLYQSSIFGQAKQKSSALAQLAIKTVQERKGLEQDAAGSDLLGRYLAASQKAPKIVAPEDVLALSISTIHAGSDTTASATAGVLVFVLPDARIVSKLEQEILQANLSDPPQFAEVDRLQYLDACLQEALRLLVQAQCSERTVAPDEVEIDGVRIPAGTDVSVARGPATHDRELFGDDAHDFRPERWLEADKARWIEMDRGMFGFSHGRRVCIGQHLARIEVKKVLGALFTNFKFHLADTPRVWEEDAAPKMNLKVRLERRK